MSSKDLTIFLTDEDITTIKNKINNIFQSKDISNPIIKDDIFRLLESESVVLYYPVQEEDACAFYMQFENEKTRENKNFVFINTAIPFDKQIFAAAHELAHIWGITDARQEVLKSKDIREYTDSDSSDAFQTDKTEKMANRFAAEFLVQEEILLNELKKIHKKGEKLTLEHVIDLMDIFLVPYKTMIKRLREIGKLSNAKEYEYFLNLDARNEKSQVVMLQKELGKCTRNNVITKAKKMPNYVKMALDLFAEKAKTFDKLTCQLQLFDLTPDDFDIKSRDESFLSDEELDKLLEEES